MTSPGCGLLLGGSERGCWVERVLVRVCTLPSGSDAGSLGAKGGGETRSRACRVQSGETRGNVFRTG